MSNHAPKTARVVPLRPAAAPRVTPRVAPRVEARVAPRGEARGDSHVEARVDSRGEARGEARGDAQGAPRTGREAEPGGRPAAEPGPNPAVREPLWRHVVGDVLRRERLDQRRTLREVAEEARISMPYLSEIERGRKEASSEVLAAAAHALGLRLADLLALAHHELNRAPTPAGGAGRAEASLTTVTELAARRAGGAGRAARPGGEVRLAA